MAKIETITVALPIETADALREAVADGAYASPSEVVSEALRDWHQQRVAREGDLARIRSSLDMAASNPTRLTDAEVGAHIDGLFEAAIAKASC